MNNPRTIFGKSILPYFRIIHPLNQLKLSDQITWSLVRELVQLQTIQVTFVRYEDTNGEQERKVGLQPTTCRTRILVPPLNTKPRNCIKSQLFKLQS